MVDINDNEEAMNEDKIINSTKTFYSKECVICLTLHKSYSVIVVICVVVQNVKS